MTTRPSSSSLAAPTTSVTLNDSAGRPVTLGKEIGRGGEGSVYEVAGQPALVAKVYHKLPLDAEQAAKMAAMVALWSEPLETISAWPRSLLFKPGQNQPCGLLMTKMAGARPLHELYGTTNRRRHFPEAGWHHLVLAARNIAAAFHTLHVSGIVVGDVNQGNMLVDPSMCLRMIDCDSFQITHAGKVHSCPVGTPHFTPPELQALKLRNVPRTTNHDSFGLAVLIFHMLFVGRHPFAGRYRGQGEMSIEKAIAERRFAFSKHRSATLVDPPPASLLLSDLPTGLGDLFESAFRANEADGDLRPAPLEWVQQLEALIKARKNCSFDDMHVYWGELDDCPWCRIEDAGGPTFFVPSGGMTVVSPDRLAACEKKINQLREITFADLPMERLALPTPPVLKSSKPRPKWTSLDTAAALLPISWLACAWGVVSIWPLAVGAIGSLAAAGYLVKAKPAMGRRLTADDFKARLAKGFERLVKLGRNVYGAHRHRETAFARADEDLKTEIGYYRAEGDRLREIIVEHSHTEKDRYLRGYLIRDYAQKIPGMTPSKLTMLESFGVETAYEVERLKLAGVPGVDGELTMVLLDWREQMERNFKFEPEHGITLKTIDMSAELAAKRFKLSQARRVLMGAKQLEALAASGDVDLKRALHQWDDQVEAWNKVARDFRDFQSGRRPLERTFNRSSRFLAALGVAIPVVTGLLYLVFGR